MGIKNMLISAVKLGIITIGLMEIALGANPQVAIRGSAVLGTYTLVSYLQP